MSYIFKVFSLAGYILSPSSICKDNSLSVNSKVVHIRTFSGHRNWHRKNQSWIQWESRFYDYDFLAQSGSRFLQLRHMTESCNNLKKLTDYDKIRWLVYDFTWIPPGCGVLDAITAWLRHIAGYVRRFFPWIDGMLNDPTIQIGLCWDADCHCAYD